MIRAPALNCAIIMEDMKVNTKTRVTSPRTGLLKRERNKSGIVTAPVCLESRANRLPTIAKPVRGTTM